MTFTDVWILDQVSFKIHLKVRAGNTVTLYLPYIQQGFFEQIPLSAI